MCKRHLGVLFLFGALLCTFFLGGLFFAGELLALCFLGVLLLGQLFFLGIHLLILLLL